MTILTPLRPVTSEETAAFRSDGAVLLRAILPSYWVDLVRAGLEEIYADPGDMTTRATGTDGEGVTMIDQYASRRNSKLGRFVETSPAAAIASSLLGSTAIRYVIDQIFYKDAGRVLPTAWHQDTPYLRVAGNDLARLWTTCDPSPSRATVSVIKGSHLWNVVYRPVGETPGIKATAGAAFSYGSNSDYDDRLPAVPDIDAHRSSFDILSWDVEPGDVLAFNGNVLHGAGGNFVHPNKRRAFATLWAGDDVRYRRRPGLSLPDVAELSGATVADGELLSAHPSVFPAFRSPPMPA
jgi:ectoine hydroxylase-related dioxygenase (phytanoyl-CoA dioxygenase family)